MDGLICNEKDWTYQHKFCTDTNITIFNDSIFNSKSSINNTFGTVFENVLGNTALIQTKDSKCKRKWNTECQREKFSNETIVEQKKCFQRVRQKSIFELARTNDFEALLDLIDLNSTLGVSHLSQQVRKCILEVPLF